MVKVNKLSDNDNSNSNSEKKHEDDFSVANIFEDFENNSELEEDINKKEIEVNKNLIYYLGFISGFLKYLNILLIIGLIISYSYIYIQKMEYSSEVMIPVCPILLGNDISYTDLEEIGTGGLNGCMSVSLAKNIYNKAFQEQTESNYKKLLGIATTYYTMKDFINSKEVIFLLDATENKKNPLDLLIKFDNVKNQFLVDDRLKIQCNNVEVSNMELTADCYAFSSLWDRTIPGFDGSKAQNGVKGGTSISIASSFLNFLDKQADFILLNKQKVFKIQNIAGEGSYSYKTPFTVKLRKRNLELK